MNRTAIASHRGGALLWPENSPTAFRQTARLPVEFVEFDVHPSRDGVIVVHHDATVDRTTSGSGPINERSWSELSQLQLKGTADERPPTLTEVIEIFAPTDIKLRLEIKHGVDYAAYSGFEQLVAGELEALGVLDRTVVTSFFLDVLRKFEEAAAATDRIWLVNPLVLGAVGGLDTILRLAREAGVGEIGLHAAHISADTTTVCSAEAFRIGAYAAHDEATIERMLNLGVSVFTTDDPVTALRVRDELLEA